MAKPDASMDEITGFQAIAPYLTNPLVLAGFALFLLFGVHRALLKAGIIPPLTPSAGNKVVQSLLRYGFVIALVVIVLGFVLAFYQTHSQHDPIFQRGEIEKKHLDAQIEAAKAAYCQHPEKFRLDEATRSAADRACARAVVALANTPDAPAAKKDDALTRLQMGDAQGAKAIFQEILDRKAAQGAAANTEAAEAARHLGALAFYDNTQEALDAYRKAVVLDPSNASGWNELGHLLIRVGQLKEAEAMYKKALDLNEALGNKQGMANNYDNLGVVYRNRGDLVQAEATYKKALELDEALGYKEGMAAAYGNLGLVYEDRGDLVQAEATYRTALELNEALGFKGGVADNYDNLGNVYEERGDLVQAEEMQKKALELNEALGRRQGMADNYGNLGNVYEAGGDLVQAEETQKKALELYEALGYKQGMANTYGNLGLVYEDRGDLVQAEAMQKKALMLSEALGYKQGMANTYGNLGVVYSDRGDLVQAEATYKKALELNEALGNKQGMADNYGNLGVVYSDRGDLVQAKAMYKKALALYTEVGSTARMQHVEGLLAKLSKPDAPTSHRSR